MFEIIENWKGPWPWYIAGIIIGLIVPTLLIIGNKTFGLSSNLRHICAACFPSNIKFFKYNWKNEIWNLFFILGITQVSSLKYLHEKASFNHTRKAQ